MNFWTVLRWAAAIAFALMLLVMALLAPERGADERPSRPGIDIHR